MANDFATSLIPSINHNPDVLSCLANLSNDEVFTPPAVANAMLDLLPRELFQNPETKFLDPACKSGVFLREITKRLMTGLEKEFPDPQKRLDHILHNQVYGIAITEITSLLSRRSLYCAKYAISPYAISKFANIDGNIRFKAIQHTWKNGKCVHCGASKAQYEREDGLESHAYEFIHSDNPQEIFKDMKFDVIIGNPPYQLETSGAGKQAIPIYHRFISQAKKLNPSYICMITPSRWFNGGMGLDDFRDSMVNDPQVEKIIDYVNAKECFPQNSVSGGVSYFLWHKNYDGDCEVININNGSKNSLKRKLNEFSIFVRYNQAIPILRKILRSNFKDIKDMVSSLMPYGLSTNVRGFSTKIHNSYKLHASDGISYLPKNRVLKGKENINKYKILISKTGAEHAGEPAKDGKFRVLTSALKVIGPGEICTHSYFTIGLYDKKENANNLLSYLKSRFTRFLILMAMSSINLSRLCFEFVPLQDFSKPWTDAELYAKYNLSQDEIDFIESMIKPMELEAEGGKLDSQ